MRISAFFLFVLLAAGVSGMAGCPMRRVAPVAEAPQLISLADLALPWVTEEVDAPRVEYRMFESRSTGGRVSYHVYVPKSYHSSTSRFPVLYWLHGTQGGVSGIRPLSAWIDTEMERGAMPALLVVFVNGLPRRLWADSKDGSAPVETMFITDLIPEVDRNFRTIASREGRILEGFSMGGYGAARIGFSYPELFAGVSMLAGGPLDLDLRGPRARGNPGLRDEILRTVCGDDLSYFRSISPWVIAECAAPALRDHKTVIRQVVGTRDTSMELNRNFHERLRALAIPHQYLEVPDADHDAKALFIGLGEANGAFYHDALSGELARPIR